ncbi:MAG: long-chain fatty acid--CoA ligase [Bdellovibrionaceae bacterium]|nr:long-chain fatty acid--CoA ligase [Pseudobdellovibrionaceae bacterium]
MPSQPLPCHYQPLPYMVVDFNSRSAETAFWTKSKNQWSKILWAEYQKDIYKMSRFLSSDELSLTGKVGIVCSTRYEWSVIDLASQCAKKTLVPIYPASTAEEMSYILNHAEVEILFLENKAQVKVWDKISAACPHVKKIVLIDKFDLIDSVIQSWDQILDRTITSEDIKKIRTRINTIRLDDEATIVYTSGTTGNPKGVVLTHQQIVSEVIEAFSSCQVSIQDRSLTFLPFSHVFGRIENWAHAYFGYEMAFAENLESIKNNLIEMNPTFAFAVPRIFEKVYMTVISGIENNQLKRTFFDWALMHKQAQLDKQEKYEQVPIKNWLLSEIAQKMILDKVKKAFGKRLRFFISGGAPLNPVIGEFFSRCGVLILEGYGLTETTAAIFVNTPFDHKVGTVGKAIGDVQIKLAEDHEILVKSHKVMVKYYKDEKATNAVFEDGWLKTGDIGELLPSGHLRITDRKKDLIKTANGKYVAPQKIEGLIKLNPLIANSLIHGDQKKYIIALLSIDHAQAKKWAQNNGIDVSDIKLIVQNPKFTDEIRQHMIKINSELANHESVKKYQVIEDEFTIENGSLTHSLKVKRKFLDAKYKTIINSLY